MTRILDINDNELQEEDLDLEAGYLEPDRIFIRHHDAIQGQDRQFHYTVKAFYFDDGSSVEIEDEHDPRIGVDNAAKGLFHYVPAVGEPARKLRGIDLREIEDSPAIEAKEAWDEYEDIQRYKVYTPEEIAEKEAERQRQAEEAERAAAREAFLATGPGRLDDAEVSIEDLVLVMADLVGGEE